MVNQTFISSEVSWAIQNYLSTKEQPLSSLPFPIVVIRTLVFIYGELDIINPYITKNEKSLGGFDDNLMKYGYDIEDLNNFKSCLTSFIKSIRVNTSINNLVLTIEKELIRMFCLKNQVMNLSNEDVLEFKKYILFADNLSLKDYTDTYITSSGALYLEQFFNSKLFMSRHKLDISLANRQTFISDAYIILGYSVKQIEAMNDKELNDVNNQVLIFFKISPTETNKNEMIIKAVNYYKKYANRLTTGNGYVDFLLLMSIMVTVIFVVTLMAFHFF